MGSPEVGRRQRRSKAQGPQEGEASRTFPGWEGSGLCRKTFPGENGGLFEIWGEKQKPDRKTYTLGRAECSWTMGHGERDGRTLTRPGLSDRSHFLF